MAASHTLPLSLLLVVPDGDGAFGAGLTGSGVDVTRCASLAEAQAMLAAAAFDAVCVAVGLPESELRALQQGRPVPVFIMVPDAAAVDGALTLASNASLEDVRLALARVPRAAPDGTPAPARGDEAALLGLIDRLRREVGRVVHAANNPMTVIMGNAQFLLELAGAGLVEPEIARALEDIEAAARKLQEELAGLSGLRQQLAAVLTTGDGLA